MGITVWFGKFRNDSTVWCVNPEMKAQVLTNNFKGNGEFDLESNLHKYVTKLK
jgi:hypothetical protein